MLFVRIAFAVTMSWFLISSQAFAQKQNEDQKNNDGIASNEAEIVLGFVGGFRIEVPNFESTPFLRIYPDGRVVTGRNAPQQEEYTWQMDEQSLTELREMFDASHFFEMDSKAISDAIEAIPNRPMVADAPNTEISVVKNGERHTVSVYAMSMIQDVSPEIKELPSLVAIEKRLRQIHAYATAGGTERIEKWLEEVNEKLKKASPDMEPFSIDQVAAASIVNNGVLSITFSRPSKKSATPQSMESLNLRVDGNKVEYDIW